jgi:hypothetical protein
MKATILVHGSLVTLRDTTIDIGERAYVVNLEKEIAT